MRSAKGWKSVLAIGLLDGPCFTTIVGDGNDNDEDCIQCFVSVVLVSDDLGVREDTVIFFLACFRSKSAFDFLLLDCVCSKKPQLFLFFSLLDGLSHSMSSTNCCFSFSHLSSDDTIPSEGLAVVADDSASCFEDIRALFRVGENPTTCSLSEVWPLSESCAFRRHPSICLLIDFIGSASLQIGHSARWDDILVVI